MPHQHNNAHGDLALDRLGCIDYRFCGISLWLIVCLSWKDKKDKEDWEPASVTLLVDKKWCNGIQNTDINSTKSNQVWSYIKLCLFDIVMYFGGIRYGRATFESLLSTESYLVHWKCHACAWTIMLSDFYYMYIYRYTSVRLFQPVTSCSCDVSFRRYLFHAITSRAISAGKALPSAYERISPWASAS